MYVTLVAVSKKSTGPKYTIYMMTDVLHPRLARDLELILCLRFFKSDRKSDGVRANKNIPPEACTTSNGSHVWLLALGNIIGSVRGSMTCWPL